MSIDRWMGKDVVHIYTMEYYSAIKKEWNNAIYSNMDGPRDYHTKWVRQRKTNTIWYHVHVESKKYIQNRNIPTDVENKLMLTKVERWGGERNKLGVLDQYIYTLLYVK